MISISWSQHTTDDEAGEVKFVNNDYKARAATHYMYAFNAQLEGYDGGMQRYFFEWECNVWLFR